MRFLGFLAVKTKKAQGPCRFYSYHFERLVEPLDQQRFEAIVTRLGANAYDEIASNLG